MDTKRMKNQLEKAFQERNWDVKWNQESGILSIILQGTDKTFEVSIPKLLDRMNREQKEASEIISEVVNQVQIVLDSMHKREKVKLAGQDQHIFPVLRSTSFPIETPKGERLVTHDHTAESRIYYALDLGQSYTLIDQQMLFSSGWSESQLREKALFNLRGLQHQPKVDVVAENHFTFISPTDGYGASRILNQSLLQEYASKAEGDFCLAIPHQDVLILADLRNSTGYDILGQMTMHFYRNGEMPITALPFEWKDGQPEPIFILAKRK